MDSVHTSLETIIIDNQLNPEGYSISLTSNSILHKVQKCNQPASGRLCFLSQIRCLLIQLLSLLWLQGPLFTFYFDGLLFL